MSDAQNRQIDLRDHQQRVEKKLDRIIKLLDELDLRQRKERTEKIWGQKAFSNTDSS